MNFRCDPICDAIALNINTPYITKSAEVSLHFLQRCIRLCPYTIAFKKPWCIKELGCALYQSHRPKMLCNNDTVYVWTALRLKVSISTSCTQTIKHLPFKKGPLAQNKMITQPSIKKDIASKLGSRGFEGHLLHCQTVGGRSIMIAVVL